MILKMINYKHTLKFSILILVLMFSVANNLFAEVKLPKLFSSNMILQRDKPIKIWGWANPGEKIKISFIGNNYSVSANPSGKWEVEMKPAAAGGPHILKINDLSLENILMGDVFFCSGQSNMAFLLMNADGGEEAIKTSENEHIRLFNVPRDIAFQELDDIAGKVSWELCNPQTVRKFSAVAYYMARKLQKDLNVPIGLVHSSYGGTVIEGFISAKPLDTIARLKPILNQIGEKTKEEFIQSRIMELEKSSGKLNQYTDNKVLWDTINPSIPLYSNQWETMKLPALWEKAGLANVDGVIWFYKEITLTKEECEKDAFLSLGRIADQSVTFFNDQKLGSSPDSRDLIRNYNISKELLKVGINKIMVRVANKGRNGGMWGPQSRMYFKLEHGNKIMIDGDWKYKIQDIKIAIHPNDVSSSVYNAMIHPLKNIQYKGAVWYQGESNANWAHEYEGLLKIMIKDWRTKFNQAHLPFIVIQLPNYKTVSKQPDTVATWALLRESQEKSLSLSNVGLVNTIDLGMSNDIHPTDKAPVGERTALKVLHFIYNKNIIADGPVFKDLKISNNKIILSFNYSDGLTVNKNSARNNFVIAGKDQKFYWANVEIEGNKVIVWNKAVKEPVAVRYAWADNPGNNYLYNAQGLPMRPFRTDSWKIITEEILR